MVGKADGVAGVGKLKPMVHKVLPDAHHAQMETLLLTVPLTEANIQYYLLLLEIKTSLIESELWVSQHFFFFQQLRWRSQRKYVALASAFDLVNRRYQPR